MSGISCRTTVHAILNKTVRENVKPNVITEHSDARVPAFLTPSSIMNITMHGIYDNNIVYYTYYRRCCGIAEIVVRVPVL